MFELTPWRRGRGLTRAGDPWPQFRSELDRLFEDFFTEPRALKTWEGAFSPTIDVSETDKEIEVTAELPGVDEKDIDVSLADGVLTIKGEKKSEKEEKDKKKNYYRVERTYGAFQRSLQLPGDVDEAGIRATFTKGVLRVAVPKKPEAKAAVKRVEVKKAD